MFVNRQEKQIMINFYQDYLKLKFHENPCINTWDTDTAKS